MARQLLEIWDRVAILGGGRLDSIEVERVDDVFMGFTWLLFRRIRPIMPESLNFGFSVHSMR